MTQKHSYRLQLATAGALSIAMLGGFLAPASAEAALVTGSVGISIDNAALAAVTGGWRIDSFFDASYNQIAITADTVGGVASAIDMTLPINTNLTTTSYAAVNRTLQATTMEVGNTASGQIGLSGGTRMSVPGTSSGSLTPYDFRLQKIGGVWNLVTYDQFFSGTTFLQLTNASETVNAGGELTLSGDLIFGNGSNKYPSPFGLTWGSFLGISATDAVVGSLSMNLPAAVPVPTAVWLFGSGLIGLIGATRRKNLAD